MERQISLSGPRSLGIKIPNVGADEQIDLEIIKPRVIFKNKSIASVVNTSNNQQQINGNEQIQLEQKDSLQIYQKIPPVTKIEIFLEIISLAILIYTWAHFFIEFNKLNNRVPSFGLDGSADDVDKDQFVLIVLIDTVVYLFMSVLQFFTHKFKYLVEVTQQNSQMIFWTTRIFILYCKFFTLVLLLYGTIALFKIVKQEWSPELMYIGIVFLIFYFLGGFIFYRRLQQVSQIGFD